MEKLEKNRVFDRGRIEQLRNSSCAMLEAGYEACKEWEQACIELTELRNSLPEEVRSDSLLTVLSEVVYPLAKEEYLVTRDRVSTTLSKLEEEIPYQDTAAAKTMEAATEETRIAIEMIKELSEFIDLAGNSMDIIPYEKKLKEYTKSWEKTKAGKMVDYIRLIGWLKDMELGKEDASHHFLYDEDKNIIGINIQDAGDGYITIGYGHTIQSEKEAKRYGFLYFKSGKSVAEQIRLQKKKYGEKIDNPAVLSIAEAEDICAEDLESAAREAERLCKKQGLEYSQNELDAIISSIYNAGTKHADDPDSLQYYLLRNKQEGAMEIIRKADREGWYAKKKETGLLRRRLMEYNIYFRNSYQFYTDKELGELEEVTGFHEWE